LFSYSVRIRLVRLRPAAVISEFTNTAISVLRTLYDAMDNATRNRGKRAVQAASVIGQRFETELLQPLIETPHYDSKGLVEHNLVRRLDVGYLFAHALIQESVYETLVKSAKTALHLQAAEWYCDVDPVLYAQHLE
jgi:predicted ATPase